MTVLPWHALVTFDDGMPTCSRSASHTIVHNKDALLKPHPDHDMQHNVLSLAPALSAAKHHCLGMVLGNPLRYWESAPFSFAATNLKILTCMWQSG